MSPVYYKNKLLTVSLFNVNSALANPTLERESFNVNNAKSNKLKRKSRGTAANSITTDVCAGKGGVGKTLIATSLAVCFSSQGKQTAIIDYDGGHSVRNTLGITAEVKPNIVNTVNPHLDLIVIENQPFVTIAEAKDRGMVFKEYLAQFPSDTGIIPYADMLNTFFGVPTDIPTLQKFVTLVSTLTLLKQQRTTNIVIDVEPTAGLERLLSNADSTVRSLRNLKNAGKVILTVIGAKWPDIAGFLKGPYIGDIERYAANIQFAVNTIKSADYLLVCTPESGPVNQTLEVRAIIEKFGGKAAGYVVNNLRDEPHEAMNIATVEKQGLPIATIRRQQSLHCGGERLPLLKLIGRTVLEELG